MKWYTQTTTLPNVQWAEPMETTWRWLRAGASVPGSKLPHLGMADQLFVAAVANTPRPARDWGAITWVANVFQISRPTVYALGKRAARGMACSLGGRPVKEPSAALPDGLPSRAATISVTANRIARTALTLAFPGKAALRPMQVCLEAAFDQSRGVGTLSELLTQAGQRLTITHKYSCEKRARCQPYLADVATRARW
jgi:hypothetical protein